MPLAMLPSCIPAVTDLVLLERLKSVMSSFSSFLHVVGKIFLQCSLSGVEERSYFKHISVFDCSDPLPKGVSVLHPLV